jgi:polysaccharide biosynthesis/export protein
MASIERARIFGVLVMAAALAAPAWPRAQSAASPQTRAQTGAAAVTPPQRAAADPAGAGGVTPPPDYVIGPSDVLTVVFWRDKDISGDVEVRPDGKISLPLINDIQAAGLTPTQLRASVTEAAKKFIEDPTVTVIVKQINSRKVFITGQVAKPGPYQLVEHMTVLQLIAMAGGLLEYADAENIVVVRNSQKRPDGVPWSYRVNYKDIAQRKHLNENIELMPGDTVIVP